MLQRIGYDPKTTPKALAKAADAFNKRLDRLAALEARRNQRFEEINHRYQADRGTDRTEYFKAAAEAAAEEAACAQEAADILGALEEVKARRNREARDLVARIEAKMREEWGIPDHQVIPQVCKVTYPGWAKAKSDADSIVGDPATLQYFTTRAIKATKDAEHFRAMAAGEKRRLAEAAETANKPIEPSVGERQAAEARKRMEEALRRRDALLADT